MGLIKREIGSDVGCSCKASPPRAACFLRCGLFVQGRRGGELNSAVCGMGMGYGYPLSALPLPRGADWYGMGVYTYRALYVAGGRGRAKTGLACT